MTRSVFVIAILCLAVAIMAQNTPCKFDEKTLQFVGKPIEQARCLLRPNKPRGILGPQLTKLPSVFEKHIGKKIDVKKDKFRSYLKRLNISEDDTGGSLDTPLSKAKLPTGEELQALYFIIHDTSTPNYELKQIPEDINLKSWKYNDLAYWQRNPVAHIFINRLGESLTATLLNETVRKGWGTKFARDFLKADAKGLQIHIELCQPRMSDPAWIAGNDAIAPKPGFSDKQYERLALVYVAASLRRGSWLIPAYHSAVDAGLKDAHDDPQNFELDKFAVILQRILKEI